jgi:bifunctional ADP-heptose synthase (sugar kinase/adenylyltransferase)
VEIAAHAREIADVSGAGDTVVSITLLCLALNLSPPLIASHSNLGGGLVCQHVGVVPIDREELLFEAKKELG